jgi:hypothetical protein
MQENVPYLSLKLARASPVNCDLRPGNTRGRTVAAAAWIST